MAKHNKQVKHYLTDIDDTRYMCRLNFHPYNYQQVSHFDKPKVIIRSYEITVFKSLEFDVPPLLITIYTIHLMKKLYSFI